jgi:hypothetical protein
MHVLDEQNNQIPVPLGHQPSCELSSCCESWQLCAVRMIWAAALPCGSAIYSLLLQAPKGVSMCSDDIKCNQVASQELLNDQSAVDEASRSCMTDRLS